MDSRKMHQINAQSVNLIITSPPYPMIKMWDEMFSKQDKYISEYLSNGEGFSAFETMHGLLNLVWDECDRVLKDNGFICINIGDATRTIADNFHLFSNHTKIIDYFQKKGYTVLPDIHWRKQTNSPNKFMGSGMYPAGAYVTYEHEYILVFRKGGKRNFKGKEKELRKKSAFFWEERNLWFSDLWDIKGIYQSIINSKSRNRNASFPFEIPYRLINMYSIKGDTVLDPFAGMGTTNIACMVANRHSIGVEIDAEIAKMAIVNMQQNTDTLNKIIDNRIIRHLKFINALPKDKLEKCYVNINHGFKVKTKQETDLEIDKIANVKRIMNGYACEYNRDKQTYCTNYI